MKQQPALGQKLMAAILNNSAEQKTPWYRRIFKARSGVSPLTRNKYGTPHQSNREMQRRLRQIERGIIQR